MTSAPHKLLAEAMALSEVDRRVLAEMLFDSVPAATSEEFEQAWDGEAVRRVDAARRGEIPLVDGREAIDGIRASLQQADG